MTKIIVAREGARAKGIKKPAFHNEEFLPGFTEKRFTAEHPEDTEREMR